MHISKFLVCVFVFNRTTQESEFCCETKREKKLEKKKCINKMRNNSSFFLFDEYVSRKIWYFLLNLFDVEMSSVLMNERFRMMDLHL